MVDRAERERREREAWEAFRAGETARLNGLARMPDGSGPAWEVAKQLPGMTPAAFEKRIARGWSPERAATEPVTKRRSKYDAFRRGLGPDDL